MTLKDVFIGEDFSAYVAAECRRIVRMKSLDMGDEIPSLRECRAAKDTDHSGVFES